MRKFARSSEGSKRLLRLAVALMVAVGSFATLRGLYRGVCIMPFVDCLSAVIWFFVLPALFLASFVWLLSELTYPMALSTGARPAQARLFSVGAGLLVYAIVGYIVWLGSPVPRYPPWETAYRAIFSVFWSVGVLVETGNFKTYACGQ